MIGDDFIGEEYGFTLAEDADPNIAFVPAILCAVAPKLQLARVSLVLSSSFGC